MVEKDSLFSLINDEEKQQILIFKELEPAQLWRFYLKNDWNH